MNQKCFVVELAHPVRGQVHRVQITYKSIAYVLGSLALLALLLVGGLSSYVRMSVKASHYNELRADFEHLRGRYQELQRVSRQHTEQMATLQTLASEVSIAYGFNQPNTAPHPSELASIDALTPTVKESIEEYNFLRNANFSTIYHRYPYQWQVHSEPSLWPVNGVIRSPFGGRLDPFSGEGAFHTGIDLSASTGTEVHVTADGVVASAGWSGRYGKLIIVDHGNGLETYYAHLSQFSVVPGQEVRLGQAIALSGGTGRVTSPHVHYEVRMGGTPVNPYRYLSKAPLSLPTKPERSDFGL